MPMQQILKHYKNYKMPRVVASPAPAPAPVPLENSLRNFTPKSVTKFAVWSLRVSERDRQEQVQQPLPLTTLGGRDDPLL